MTSSDLGVSQYICNSALGHVTRQYVIVEMVVFPFIEVIQSIVDEVFRSIFKECNKWI